MLLKIGLYVENFDCIYFVVVVDLYNVPESQCRKIAQGILEAIKYFSVIRSRKKHSAKRHTLPLDRWYRENLLIEVESWQRILEAKLCFSLQSDRQALIREFPSSVIKYLLLLYNPVKYCFNSMLTHWGKYARPSSATNSNTPACECFCWEALISLKSMG